MFPLHDRLSVALIIYIMWVTCEIYVSFFSYILSLDKHNSMFLINFPALHN